MLKQIVLVLPFILLLVKAQDVQPPSNLDPITHLPLIKNCTGFVLQVCPIGTIQNGTYCTRPISACPQAYIWDGHKCTYQIKSCPQGYKLEGHECVAPTPVCPFNTRWNGVFCKQEMMDCPPGTVYRDNACFSVHTTCPFDMILHGDNCVYSVPLCPEGYSMQGNGFCRSNVGCDKPGGSTESPFFPPPNGNYICPEGYIWNNRECVPSDIAKLPPCPPNYTLKYGRCWPEIVPEDPNNPNNPDIHPIQPCPPRHILQDGRCWPIFTQPPIYRPPIIEPCPLNYTSENGRCWPNNGFGDINKHPPTPPPSITLEKCPPNYNLRNGTCWPNIIPTSSPTLVNCPPNYIISNGKCYPRLMTTTRAPQVQYPPRPPGDSHININISPVETIVHNNNTINKEVTVNNENINNVFVYSDVRCKDGSIRTMIVKNNETISGCPEKDENEIDDYDAEDINSNKTSPSSRDPNNKNCCEVITPRQCHQRNGSWICANRKYNRCGSFCSSGTVYLQPSRPISNSTYVLMAPPNQMPYMPACTPRYCPSVDCSGCSQGMHQCTSQCFSSTCQTTSCNFVSQESFCGTYGGGGCSQEDGCLSC